MPWPAMVPSKETSLRRMEGNFAEEGQLHQGKPVHQCRDFAKEVNATARGHFDTKVNFLRTVSLPKRVILPRETILPKGNFAQKSGFAAVAPPIAKRGKVV